MSCYTADIDAFIRRMRSYAGAEVLTRQMCFDLIEYVTVDKNTGDRSKPRKIHIYYKFLDKALSNNMISKWFFLHRISPSLCILLNSLDSTERSTLR